MELESVSDVTFGGSCGTIGFSSDGVRLAAAEVMTAAEVAAVVVTSFVLLFDTSSCFRM